MEALALAAGNSALQLDPGPDQGLGKVGRAEHNDGGNDCTDPGGGGDL